MEAGLAKFDFVFMHSFLSWNLFVSPTQDALRMAIATSGQDWIGAQPILEIGFYCWSDFLSHSSKRVEPRRG